MHNGNSEGLQLFSSVLTSEKTPQPKREQSEPSLPNMSSILTNKTIIPSLPKLTKKDSFLPTFSSVLTNKGLFMSNNPTLYNMNQSSEEKREGFK